VQTSKDFMLLWLQNHVQKRTAALDFVAAGFKGMT